MRRRPAAGHRRPAAGTRRGAVLGVCLLLAGCGTGTHPGPGPGPDGTSGTVTGPPPTAAIRTTPSVGAVPTSPRPAAVPSGADPTDPAAAGPAPRDTSAPGPPPSDPAPGPTGTTGAGPSVALRTAAAHPPVAGSGFVATVSPIDDALAARMATSWRPGCPVALAELRYLTVTHRGADGSDHTGGMVVAASVADDVVAVLRQVYDAGYPITSMRVVDDFGGDDDASMAADNTSAFNCRPVTGGGGFSEHSYGTAIDLNPVANPYVRGDTVLPPAGREFRTRPDRPAVLHAGDAVVTAFAAAGWEWGGSWTSPTDYQHFSVNGR
ncbi:M15 family metallopeptidase [Nakamurella deserti]|uniref:M15 family metallopeptidase n=1 Tax=Nakamurella deserti TaxID=2164074 RepID=UPI001F0CAF8C|nr:M15 family metallopeptidase [Nakamurella deserti]